MVLNLRAAQFQTRCEPLLPNQKIAFVVLGLFWTRSSTVRFGLLQVGMVRANWCQMWEDGSDKVLRRIGKSDRHLAFARKKRGICFLPFSVLRQQESEQCLGLLTRNVRRLAFQSPVSFAAVFLGLPVSSSSHSSLGFVALPDFS